MSPLLFMHALHATPHDIAVTWRGVEGCEERGFRDSLEGYLAGGPRQRTVAVAVERVAAVQWAATLELSTGGVTSMRRLRGSSCAELTSAAAFITAVLVDPGTLARAEPGGVPAPPALVPEPAPASVPETGASVGLWAVGARGCGVLRPPTLEVLLCGAVEAGQVIGEGVGFTGRRRDRFAWLAGVMGPALAWAPRRWLALWLGAELAVPVLGGEFEARGLGRLYRIAPVSLRAGLGIEARFF